MGGVTLKQDCSAASPNVILPVNRNTGIPITNYRFTEYRPMLFENGLPTEYSSENLMADTAMLLANTPLRLDSFPDGTGIIECGTESIRFYVWGSNKCYYSGNSRNTVPPATSIPTLNWRELVIFKQAIPDNEEWNRRTQYPIIGLTCPGTTTAGTYPNFVGINLNIEDNTEVVVLSGYKAFNRFYFDNGGGITAGESVKFTSSCNMWGGIMVDNQCNLNFNGSKEYPIELNNANVGITIANDMTTYGGTNGLYLSVSFPFGAPRNADSESGNPSEVKIKNTNFANNYFSIYALAETGTDSYIRDCDFYSYPDQMLPPYEIKNGQKTAMEAAIVLYTCKTNTGAFYTATSKLDISGCNFLKGYITGIILPNGQTLDGHNYFYNPMFCGIRYYLPKYGAESPNGFSVANQEINVHKLDSYTYSEYKHQLDFLDSYWNTINGFYGDIFYNCSNPVVPYSFSANPNIARHGLSTGYPKIWNTNFMPLEGSVGIYSPYDATSSAAKYLDVKDCVFNGNGANTYGIITGAIQKAENNSFTNLNYGIFSEQYTLTEISNNLFNQCNNGITFNAFNPNLISTSAIYDYKIHCNIFNSTGNANGIVLEAGCNISNLSLDDDEGGNVFPVVAGTDRSLAPTQNVQLAWNSPTSWYSINNKSTSLVKYFRFSNEFVGSYLPSLDFSRLRVLESSNKCYTYSNPAPVDEFNNPLPDFKQICDVGFASNPIYFPFSASGRKASETNTNNLAISIYPNPSKNFVAVKGLNAETIVSLDLLDAKGVKLPLGSSQLHLAEPVIDLTHLQSGIYTLHLVLNNSIKVFQIVKQ